MHPHNQCLETILSVNIMFYNFYTLLKVDPVKSEQKKNGETSKSSDEEHSESDDNHHLHGHNPYIVFLDNIGDSVEEEAGSGLLGGLKSWLGFAGSMTGAGANVLSEPQNNKPWLRGDKVDAT